MNDFKECINTATYIANKITEITGYEATLKKIKESTDEDDFYILYRMTVNGKNYKLYAGDEDFTIAGEDNEIYIESDGFNTNRNIEYFCKRIEEVNEKMNFGDAKQVLKENGYIVESNGDGQTTWEAEKYKPKVSATKKLADKLVEEIDEWLWDNDEASAADLGYQVVETLEKHKKEIFKEFSKYVVYGMLSDWYTGDDDDVHDLITMINDKLGE